MAEQRSIVRWAGVEFGALSLAFLCVILTIAVSPLASTAVRDSAFQRAVVSAGGAAGDLIPRGRWSTEGPVPPLQPGHLDTGLVELCRDYLVILENPVASARCFIPGTVFHYPVTSLSALAAAVVLTIALGCARHDRPRAGRQVRFWAENVTVSAFAGLVIGAAELCTRVFWTSASETLTDRSRVFFAEGDLWIDGVNVAGPGGGWLLEHGQVLAMGWTALWMIRAGVWGLGLLGVLALAGWKPARRWPVAAAWAAACLVLLASPWWLAYLIGPLWIG